MTDTERDDYTAGLRALADILDTHPEVPLPYQGSGDGSPIVIHHLHGADLKAEFAATVRAFPGTKTKAPRDTYFDVEVTLHGLRLDIVAYREAVCERVVTGTKTVTREIPAQPAAEARTVTETVEQVEWICQPILAPVPA